MIEMVFDTSKKNVNEESEWPDGVLERLQGYADASGIPVADAQQKFVEYLSDKYAVDNWQDEDEDFLIEASEGMVVTRRSGGGGLQTENWVGMFVGSDGKTRDKRRWLREQALNAWNEDPDKAVSAGIVARCVKENGVWCLVKADGTHPTEEPEDTVPWFLLNTDKGPIALLQTGEWSSKGDPIRHELLARYHYFLGNTEKEFGNSVGLFRLESTDVNAQVAEWKPCRLKVVPNTKENQNPDFADVFRLPRKWTNDVVYTTDFVEADLQPQLAPEKFAVNPAVHNNFCSLTDMLERYHSGLKEVAGLNPIGPLGIIKGKVTSLFKEGWDNEYDPSGKSYNLRLTSWDLQREHPSGLRSEVNVRISGHHRENCHAFEYLDGDSWRPYAERSTVLVFGRFGVRQTEDDGEVPQITAFGIFAVPRFVVPAAEGGNTGTDQFGGGGQ
jgi:hypothetical protein|tara:strand:+ start:6696 stop:8024 length:1329 start_codon:yes stop_codon:yes gene_type:complete